MGKPDASTRRSGTEKSEADERIFKDVNVQEEEHHFIREAVFWFLLHQLRMPDMAGLGVRAFGN